MRTCTALGVVALLLSGCGRQPETTQVNNTAAAAPSAAVSASLVNGVNASALKGKEKADFDGDGEPETVSIITYAAAMAEGLRFDNPWARSVDEKPQRPRRAIDCC